MLAAPSVAIDLPLKLLVREDFDAGEVWVELLVCAGAAGADHALAEKFAAM